MQKYQCEVNCHSDSCQDWSFLLFLSDHCAFNENLITRTFACHFTPIACHCIRFHMPVVEHAARLQSPDIKRFYRHQPPRCLDLATGIEKPIRVNHNWIYLSGLTPSHLIHFHRLADSFGRPFMHNLQPFVNGGLEPVVKSSQSQHLSISEMTTFT